jgi:hypothetical protein
MDEQKEPAVKPLIHMTAISDYWYKVSLDNGLDWVPLGQAAGPQKALYIAETALMTALLQVKTLQRETAAKWPK